MNAEHGKKIVLVSLFFSLNFFKLRIREKIRREKREKTYVTWEKLDIEKNHILCGILVHSWRFMWWDAFLDTLNGKKKKKEENYWTKG